MNELVIVCKRCSRTNVMPHKDNPHLCDACVKAEDSRVSHFRMHNYNWMEAAKEAEIELWERQPEETQHEYGIWLRYRDAYPARKPTYRLVAEELGTTVNAVKKVGMRWSFPARLQAWAKRVDEITMKQREAEILAMNQRHISMAEKIQAKLERAIDLLQPEALTPRELNALFKLSSEIEAKARLNEPTRQSAMVDDNPDLKKKTVVKADQMPEVLEILSKAGLLGGGAIGIRQTTEIVVKEGQSDG